MRDRGNPSTGTGGENDRGWEGNDLPVNKRDRSPDSESEKRPNHANGNNFPKNWDKNAIEEIRRENS